jgi:Flp pilus assembly protein TadD
LQPDFDVRFAKAVVQATRGEPTAKAVEQFMAWRKQLAQFWPARFYLGMLHRRRGELVAARRELEGARRLRPDNPDLLNELAVVCHRQGEARRALRLVDRALSAAPDEVGYLLNRAVFLADLARFDDAWRTFAAAANLRPGHAMLRVVESELRRLESGSGGAASRDDADS